MQIALKKAFIWIVFFFLQKCITLSLSLISLLLKYRKVVNIPVSFTESSTDF